MAVSLSQLSQEVNKRRSMAYYPAEATHMPVPQYYQHQPLYQQQAYLPQSSAQLAQYGYQNSPQPQYNYQPYAYLQEQPPTLPPRPPKTPLEPNNGLGVPAAAPPTTVPHSLSTISGVGSNQTTALPPSSRLASSGVQPDPLPPHSNPQALTKSQSHAFESASSMAPVRIGKDEIWSSQTGFALYVITREAAHMPSFLSSKPFLTVNKTENGHPLGSIRFHSMTTSAIDLMINGRQTSIAHSGWVHDRWGFQSLTCPNVNEKWYWKKDKASGGVVLKDAKKNGKTLARIKGDLLILESGNLTSANCDEILLSAIAMAEAARRQSKGKEIADLGNAIGDFAAAAGADGGGGGGDGGGGGGGGGGC